MKIAIIGGGAAGMASAYLIHKRHAVSVFEKEPMLGGNIRTLNKNVTDVDLDPDIVVDNGVIEFLKDHSPHFNRLMADLGVALEYVPGVSTQIFFENGHTLQAQRAIHDSAENLPDKLGCYLKLLPLLRDHVRIQRTLRGTSASQLAGQSVSNIFGDGKLYRWIKMLLMYSYSIPYAQIDELPIELATGILQEIGAGARWNRIVGGVYTYIEKIIERFSGEIYCGVNISKISRLPDHISVDLSTGESLMFDAVIFATPPDQMLKLLADPTETERRLFGVWKPNFATTVIHTDLSIYDRFGVRHYTEFDVFEKSSGLDAGYNAYLNRLCGISPNHPVAYNLAYNMADQINPELIIHTQHHHTPLYETVSFKTRDQIIAINGQNRTFHAGAYLRNGLHEGAITSAFTVARLLGGRTL